MERKSDIRVRFAPSPTGLMHLGNVRAALMNYLFARQNNGTFILRIEDTDLHRNYDPGAKQIIADLDWLQLHFDEGPFFQSERSAIYEEWRKKLENKGLIYRCFCTPEELERKRERQIAMKQPPRYDRACLHLSDEQIKQKLKDNVPFIWRVKLDIEKTVIVTDLAHGPITFELKNFFDFPITRQDGTVTFMFANFVDDVVMNITHVFRGEDHLTNSAGQAFLYEALGQPMPVFWHLPILCNIEGKKLSKRDFGFSLGDIRKAGFISEALVNYSAIIGGGSFDQEIMSLEELARKFDFTTVHSTGHVRYDVEKLRWFNHQWLQQLSAEDLANRALPFLQEAYPEEMETVTIQQLIPILQIIKTDLTTLPDVPLALSWYFNEPAMTPSDFALDLQPEFIVPIARLVKTLMPLLNQPDEFVNQLKKEAHKQEIPIKYAFLYVRFALIAQPNGPSIVDVIRILGPQESALRLERADLVTSQVG